MVIAIPVVIFSCWVYVRLTSEPTWWKPVDPTSISTDATAESLENYVISQIHKIRPNDNTTWKIELDENEVNCWLASRLPKWAINRIPGSVLANGQLKQIHVRFLPQSINLGLRYDRKGDKLTDSGQVIAISLVPSMDSESGKLSITIKEVFLGRLPIPVDVGIKQLAKLSGDNSEDFVNFILGKAIEPSISLSDDRQVRITNFYLVSERITIEFTTRR